MTNKKSPAVEVARKLDKPDRDIYETTLEGYMIRVVPVSAPIITDAASMIEDPEVPMYTPEGKDTAEPNPDHPDYIKAVRRAESDRAQASMDAMIMFGIELIGELPPDEKWLKKLQWLAKKEKFPLDDYDLDDPLDKEFLFKRYFCSTVEILEAVSDKSQVSEAEVRAAEDSFPSDEARD
jgi:hypothetical protein